MLVAIGRGVEPQLAPKRLQQSVRMCAAADRLGDLDVGGADRAQHLMAAGDRKAAACLRFGRGGREATAGSVSGTQQMLETTQLAGKAKDRIDRRVGGREVTGGIGE